MRDNEDAARSFTVPATVVKLQAFVFGGFLAGLAWLAFVASIMTAVRFFADRRPETRTEEHDLNN